MTTQNTNPESLQQLQNLLVEGNDAKILNFVKTTFAEQLPTYLNMAEEVSQMHNVILQLRLDDLKRQIEHNKTMQKVAQSIDMDEIKYDLKKNSKFKILINKLQRLWKIILSHFKGVDKNKNI